MTQLTQPIDGYVFTSDRQAVVDAVVGIIPKDQWKHLHRRTKVLLAAVVVLRNKRKYYAAGFLKMSLVDLFKELGFIEKEYQMTPIRDALKRKYITNGMPSAKTRAKFLVTPAVQECLDDLARHDEFKRAFPNQPGLHERSLQIVGELGEDGTAALIHALRGRMTSCVPSS
ncbi:MAG TPA: hypothetical protein VFO38_01540 [Candidatus Saccharimonadales bacterium]|nr:hypothetical protein [Candidatus Saccharimonadales bacterium]